MDLKLPSRRPHDCKRFRNHVFGIASDCRGLTLLETVVALAILAIGIVAILHVFSVSLTSTKEAESYSTAAILADEIASQLDSSSSVASGQQSGTFDEAANYSWTADIQAPDDNGLMRAAITVSWMAGNNPRHYNMVIFLKPDSTGTSQTTGSSTSGPGGSG